MRIRRLRLRNYRRYRDTEVEFPDGVLALLGRNGSGKSTLLEAISFALFGPGAVRTAKDLLRSDSAAPGDAVHVELDLELGGQAIRIQRELRGKALAPSASLEVDGVVLVPPGAGSSEAATRELERRLGMDRDAFHTTVVAQQGELSRLADAKPADRKRLVLRMLGIDRVDGAIEEARSRRNVATLTLERMRGLLPDLSALETQAQAAQASLLALEGQGKELEAGVAQAQAEATARRIDAEAQERAAQVAREQALQLAAARAEENHHAADAARLGPEIAQAEAAAQRAEQLAPLASDVAAREEQLRAATLVEAARGQHTERLRYAARQRELVERLQGDVTRLVVPPDAGPRLQVGQEGLVAVETNLQACSQELAVLESRLADVESRRLRLCALGPQAPCPTCERPLNGQFEHLHQSVEESTRTLLLHRQAAADKVVALRREADLARVTIAAAVREANEHQRIVMRRAELERRAADEGARLAELEQTIGPEPPPAPDMPRLRASVLEARRAREDQVQALVVAGRLAGLRAQVAQVNAKLEAARNQRVAIEKALVPFDQARLIAAQRDSERATNAVRELERRLHENAVAVQRAQAETVHCQRRIDEARVAFAQVQLLEGELQVLNAVVGRTGGGLLDRFRDHLVGRVGPAISAEASRLLTRFSGGRYTEILLDDDYQVFVTDQGVAYALERFSGGEADLVHLALRLAVSRLLAERGGVELRFLALDEVFGSLDRERREHVVAALQELGTMYSQVLVVSHLEGLQEALGQCLRVTEPSPGEATLVLE